MSYTWRNIINLSLKVSGMHALCVVCLKASDTFASHAVLSIFTCFCMLSWEFLAAPFLSWTTRSDYWQLKFEFHGAGLIFFLLLVGFTGHLAYNTQKYLKQSRETRRWLLKELSSKHNSNSFLFFSGQFLFPLF